MYPDKLLNFINEHQGESIEKLLLSSPPSIEVDLKIVASTLKGKEKLSVKNREWARHPELIFVSSQSVEQSSSQLAAQYKSSQYRANVIIDITGGLGVDSYYFSKTSDRVYYIEKERSLADAATHNFNKLNTKNISVICSEFNKEMLPSLIQRVYQEQGEELSISFYADPSRRSGGNRVKGVGEYSPNLLELKEEIFDYSNSLLLKISPMEDIKQVVEYFQSVSKVEVISINNECKELLLYLQKGSHLSLEEIPVNVVMIALSGEVKNHLFNYLEEERALPQYGDCKAGHYLYEPDSALLKAGAYKEIATSTNSKKLAKSTHLYTSKEVIPNFPGRSFIIKEVANFDKQTVRNLYKKLPKANITTRNFPLTADLLRKKLQILDGGEMTIVAYTLDDGQKKLAICEKVN